MAYRDLDKRRERTRERVRRYRAKQKGVTGESDVTPEVVTPIIPVVTPLVKHLSWDELKGRSAVRGK